MVVVVKECPRVMQLSFTVSVKGVTIKNINFQFIVVGLT